MIAILFPRSEDVENVARVALGAVRYENFVGRNTESGELIFHNCFAQEVIALFRSVAAESCGIALLVDGVMHRLAAGFGERFRHIAYSTTDEAGGCVGIGVGVSSDTASDFGKEVTGLQLEEIVVDTCHDFRIGMLEKFVTIV